MHPVIPNSGQPLTLHVRSAVWLVPDVSKSFGLNQVRTPPTESRVSIRNSDS